MKKVLDTLQRENTHEQIITFRCSCFALQTYSVFFMSTIVNQWQFQMVNWIFPSASAGGGVGNYLKAQTANSSNATVNDAAADDSSKKSKAKVLILGF